MGNVMHGNELRRKISIQKRSTTLDDYGQQIDVWTEVVSTMASMRAARRSLEREAGMQVGGSLTHTIATRYQAVLTPPLEVAAWRIVYNGRIIGIISARILEEKDKWIVFDCLEGSMNGS